MSDTPASRRKLSAIMMVDVSGFSRMMGRDEERTVRLIRAFQDRVQKLVNHYEGRVVNTAGDSAFGEFDSVHNAMSCAQAIQQSESALQAEQPAEERIAARIGVHLGDVIVEDYHVYGDGVNIAARLEPMADPGGICISEAVYQQIRNRLTAPVEDLGLQELKNIEHPIRIYRIAPVATLIEPHPPAARPAQTVAAEAVAEADLRTTTLILGIVGGFLFLSPLLLFPSGGVLPTAGAVVLAIAGGRLWGRASRRPGRVAVSIGIAIASAALWTNWSYATNALFIVAGLIVAVSASAKKR